jgi:hypothetical protein
VDTWKTAATKNPKTWTTEERLAWDEHVNETIRTLYDLVEKGRVELEERERRAASG